MVILVRTRTRCLFASVKGVAPQTHLRAYSHEQTRDRQRDHNKIWLRYFFVSSVVVQQFLTELGEKPIGIDKLNQMLRIQGSGAISEAVFNHYWLVEPAKPLYDHTSFPGYQPLSFREDSSQTQPLKNNIDTLDRLEWGMSRLYSDLLLNFGNIQEGFNKIRMSTADELRVQIGEKRFDTNAMSRRDRVEGLKRIDPNIGYLIFEYATNTLGDPNRPNTELHDALLSAYSNYTTDGTEPITVKDLLSEPHFPYQYTDMGTHFRYTARAVEDTMIESSEDITAAFQQIKLSYAEAINRAERNTDVYRSIRPDLDLYCAVSMRKLQDAIDIHGMCKTISKHPDLSDLHIRYFDPTISAAQTSKDKGIIEDLMVRSAKVLICHVGKTETFGKSAESAMALKMGKPVIWLCESPDKALFYRETHPLTCLPVSEKYGASNGTLIAESIDEVVQLLSQIYRNEVQYELKQPRPGEFQLREKSTQSIKAFQSGDIKLRRELWETYSP